MFRLSLCTHILCEAVKNRDEKNRMRGDMNCNLVLSTQKLNACLKKIIFLFLLSLSKYLDNKKHFVICVAEQHVAFES